MCDNVGELGIFIAGCTVMIVLATGASVGCHRVCLCKLIDSSPLSQFIIFSVMYFVLHDSMNYKNY